MLGAIIGDMVGSIYEFDPIKSKNFDIFNPFNKMTDDSFLTLAVARVLVNNYPIDYSTKGLEKIKKALIEEFVKEVDERPYAGYGGMFYNWAILAKYKGVVEPYNSFGNGSAMRISPVGWICNSEDEVKKLSKAVSEITHNHPEGIKGAEAVAMCIYLARNKKDKDYIKKYVKENYYPEIDTFNYEELVKTYQFNETCQKSVPHAIYCFLVSDSVEDAIRNCIGIGGDCDTTGAMAGAIAEAFYQKDELSEFEKKFISLQIKKEYYAEIKKFYHTVNNKKLENIK